MIAAYNTHESRYRSLNFWLIRQLTEENYVQDGRFQTLEQAIEVHKIIYASSKLAYPNLIEVVFDDVTTMFDIIKNNVKK